MRGTPGSFPWLRSTGQAVEEVVARPRRVLPLAGLVHGHLDGLLRRFVVEGEGALVRLLVPLVVDDLAVRVEGFAGDAHDGTPALRLLLVLVGPGALLGAEVDADPGVDALHPVGDHDGVPD